jgi:hypothetical protein
MSQTGYVRKLMGEKELLDLFNSEIDNYAFKSNKYILEEDEMEEDEMEEDEEEDGEELSAEEAMEELDLDKMSDREKISLAHEILSKCKDIDCDKIMSSLEELAGGESEEEEDEED